MIIDVKYNNGIPDFHVNTNPDEKDIKFQMAGNQGVEQVVEVKIDGTKGGKKTRTDALSEVMRAIYDNVKWIEDKNKETAIEDINIKFNNGREGLSVQNGEIAIKSTLYIDICDADCFREEYLLAHSKNAFEIKPSERNAKVLDFDLGEKSVGDEEGIKLYINETFTVLDKDDYARTLKLVKAFDKAVNLSSMREDISINIVDKGTDANAGENNSEKEIKIKVKSSKFLTKPLEKNMSKKRKERNKYKRNSIEEETFLEVNNINDLNDEMYNLFGIFSLLLKYSNDITSVFFINSGSLTARTLETIIHFIRNVFGSGVAIFLYNVSESSNSKDLRRIIKTVTFPNHILEGKFLEKEKKEKEKEKNKK